MKLLVVTLIILGTSFLYSQDIRGYGIKIGLTSSSIYTKNTKPFIIGNTTYNIDYPKGQLISPTISLWAKLLTNNTLNLEVEAAYILKGSGETNLELVSPNDPHLLTVAYKSVTFNYFQISINSQIKQKIGDVSIYGIIGPSAGYLFKASNFVLQKSFNSDIIFGYNFGLGIDFSEELNKNIFFEIKYNGEFTDFYENDNGEFWNKVWVFNFGTTF